MQLLPTTAQALGFVTLMNLAGCQDLMSPADPPSDGTHSVKLFVDADSDFDRWTENPDPAQQAWMREYYHRMQTYSPYFDSRLSWYPNAWVYRDSYAVYQGSEVLTVHPEWVLRDTAGRMLFVPWGCSGGTCPQYAADIGNSDYRQEWIDRLGETLEQGYIGVWVDDVNLDWRVSNGNGDSVTPVDPRTGMEMTLADWRRYFAEFMEEVRAAFPQAEIVHNVIWYAGPPDDSFVQRQQKAANFINLERGATDSGIRGGTGTYGYESFLSFIDRVHVQGGGVILDDDDSDTDAERDYELATYLLIMSGKDMIGSDGARDRITPAGFWKGYGIDVGAPLGERYFASEVLQRDFRCGKVLVNQPEMQTRTVALDATYVTIDGNTVTSVTLEESSASVLLKETCLH